MRVLELEGPATRYEMSSRAYKTTSEPIEYGTQDHIRKVQGDGKISFKGRECKIGRAFFGYPVAIRPTIEDGVFDIFFCHQKVSRIDLNNSITIGMDV